MRLLPDRRDEEGQPAVNTVTPRRLFCRLFRTHLEALGVSCETRLAPPMRPFWTWPWVAWRCPGEYTLHVLHIRVYQLTPLLVLRAHIDGEEFRAPYGRGLLIRHQCKELAPCTNDEISFLPDQAPAVARWLAHAIAADAKLPNYYWWPGAAEERAQAYLRAAHEAAD